MPVAPSIAPFVRVAELHAREAERLRIAVWLTKKALHYGKSEAPGSLELAEALIDLSNILRHATDDDGSLR